MEKTGFKIDISYRSELEAKLSNRLKEVKEECYAIIGEKMNLLSHCKLSEFLYKKLRIPVIKKTPSGAPSTDEDALNRLKDKHEVIPKILEVRKLVKLLSTYVASDAYELDDSNRVHSTYSITGSRSSRLSSSNPNLQNIPSDRMELGREIRNMFISEEGRVLVNLDYSQIELRVCAHLSGDRRMRDAFHSGRDIHQEVGMRIFKTDKITKEQRALAKTVNFGVIYGITPSGLVRSLRKGGINISENEAEEYIKIFFKEYPGVKKYVERCISEVNKYGYIKNMFGRRRRFSLPIDKKVFNEVINFPIQSSASDIFMLGMIAVWDEFRNNEDVLFVNTVHDSLLLEIAEGKVKDYVKNMIHLMENVDVGLSVPLKVNAELGQRWGEMNPVCYE